MLLIFLISLILPILMISLNSYISNKSFNDREKISPFECGFDPQFFSRAPFSMQFFLIAIIFLIFDVEITLIMPIPLLFQFKYLTEWFILTAFFVVILILGLLHEWNQGALYWPK